MIIYKDIPGYEGYYQAGTDGSIRSVTKVVKQHSGATQTKTGKILKPAKDRIGYMNCALSRFNKLSSFKVHRLVALAHIPNPKGYREINHKDANKLNNHVDNLEWCDRSYNIRHAVANGLIKYHSGDDNYATMFKKAEHPQIIDLKKSGKFAPEIARIMGCSHYTIYRILKLYGL